MGGKENKTVSKSQISLLQIPQFKSSLEISLVLRLQVDLTVDHTELPPWLTAAHRNEST